MPKRTSLYFVEDYVDIWFDHEHNILVLKCFNLTTRQHIQIAGNIHIKAIEQYGTKAVILDMGIAKGSFYPNEWEYFMKTLFPQAQKKGVRVCFFILPKNPITAISARRFMEMGKQFDRIFIEVVSKEEAVEKFLLNRDHYGSKEE
jgi:hypothetical protein